MTATEAPPENEVEEDIWPPDREVPGLTRLKSHLSAQGVTTFIVLAACVWFVFHELQPSNLFASTTPAGGDMGAHVWLPDFVKRGLLPHWRLTGWTPDWYDGFPALTFYFPLPIWTIALTSYVIPYDVAFKLISALGLITLPLSAYAFGRLARIRFPGPALLAVATVPYLFGREYTIYGGNIASTMAGEFSFSISLSLSLIFLGLVARGLQNGKHRALAAVVLACVGLSHILPLLFSVGGAAVLMLMSLYSDRDFKRLRWGIPVLITGGALIAWWALPFWYRLPYATNMGYGKITDYSGSLTWGGRDDWLVLLAVIAFAISLARRNLAGIFFGIMAALSAIVFVITPASRLWNARALPFWFLCLYLLLGIAAMEIGLVIIENVRRDHRANTASTVTVAMGSLIAVMVWVNFPLHNLPFGHLTSSGKYEWMGIKSSDSSFIPDWVTWNYSGYQSSGKTRNKEYFALIAEMQKIGDNPQYGCGRAMWQYEPELDQMGTPDALMLLPYWTQGCIGSQEGLYYESSATTPYHFLNAAELSETPSNPVRGLDYPSTYNVSEGIQHLQMLGVKYFMAETPAIEAQADADSNLLLVGTVGPFPVTYTTGNTSSVKQRTWKIYEVLDSDLVTPLLNQPVVIRGIQSRNPAVWLSAAESWYLDPSRWDVEEAASGPASWAQVTATQTNLPRKSLPAVQVSNIKQSNESISFDVDQTGVPVLVKTSYFPNWQASGAKGIYRVAPNLMVVVPTANHVELSYGYTPIDWIGFVISLLGLAAVVVLWRMRPVAYRERRRSKPAHFARRDARSGNDKVSGAMGRFPPDVLDAVFKAYDIRGVVPEQMNADLAEEVGRAFARYCGAPRVLVGRDMRPSGVALAEAFARGVLSTGVDVVDLGMTSTDELYYACGSLDAPGAMFTASHNPAQYNGIKLCRAGARPVGADSGLREIRAAVAASEISPIPDAAEPGGITTADVLADYAAKVRSFVDASLLRPLHVIADTANGMGGLVVPAVFDRLPFRLEVLFPELDGTFPNHPADPIQPENLVALRDRILETGADIGLAFDGDADRCFLVDDRGEPLSGSTTTALVAAAMLEKSPGATVLYNLICSKAVPEIIRERGGVAVKTRVGHSFIKGIMADTDALFGGEHSGHYYFRDNYRADSGCIAALVVLEVLSQSDRPLSELRKDYERYAASGELNTAVDDPQTVIEEVAGHFEGAAQDRLDGLTVDLGDWWFNLRPSNTEPLLRLNLEARDRESCDEHTHEVLALLSPVADEDAPAIEVAPPAESPSAPAGPSQVEGGES